uniref:Coiled-coil domain containing 122 n=1 Tax=Pseudonaja textilis TaxID=8673 RepID=A0A670YB17_PSETE
SPAIDKKASWTILDQSLFLRPTHLTGLDSVVAERKAVERQRYFSEEALAAARGHCEDLEAQIAASHGENVKLTQEVDALQEDLETKVLGNRAYSEKMAAHRKRFEEAESKFPFVVELARKRAAVQQLMEKKEELLASLREGEEEATVGQVKSSVLEGCGVFGEKKEERKRRRRKKRRTMESLVLGWLFSCRRFITQLGNIISAKKE